MIKEEKGFEAKINSMYSGKGCACKTGVLEKIQSSLKQVQCKKCGKTFKTNKNTEYCFDCRNNNQNLKRD